VDIIQLDPGRCQGLTSCKKAISLIEAANLKFTAHTWSSALNTAASVHLLASSRVGLTMDFKPHESPMQDELVSDPWVQSDGYLRVRETPGLGVNVRESVVCKYMFK
jgi:L-alanine-DL-glutamate epimerase-like enolase superfamily enzyme